MIQLMVNASFLKKNRILNFRIFFKIKEIYSIYKIKVFELNYFWIGIQMIIIFN